MRLYLDGYHRTLVVAREVAARGLSEYSKVNAHSHNALLEIDTDGREDPQLPAITAAIGASDGCSANLACVMTHAGSSFSLTTRQRLAAMAEQEHSGCVHAAQALRSTGFWVSTVSVASTPTALSADSLEGVTEVRSDRDVLFGLVMACVGVSELATARQLNRKAARDRWAMSALPSAIQAGHRPLRVAMQSFP